MDSTRPQVVKALDLMLDPLTEATRRKLPGSDSSRVVRSPLAGLSIEQYEEVVQSFSTASQALAKEIALRIAVVNQQRNSLAPISQLPAEILGHIFFECLENFDQSHSAGLQELASVCNHWRRVVINTSKLWTNPRETESLDLAFSKCKGALLTLHRNINVEPVPFHHLVSQISTHSAGVSSLTLEVGSYWFRYMKSCIESPFPNLHTLALKRTDDSRMDDYIFDVEKSNLPSLRHLSLNGAVFRWDSGVMCNLRSLYLRDIIVEPEFPQHLFTCLSTSPDLESLCLLNVSTNDASPNLSIPTSAIDLPNLKTIDILSTADIALSVFQNAYIPNATEVKVDAKTRSTEQCTALLSAFTHTRRKGRKPLLVAALKKTSAEPLYLELFQHHLSVAVTPQLQITVRADGHNMHLGTLSPVIRVLQSRSDPLPVHLHLSPRGAGYKERSDLSLLARLPRLRRVQLRLSGHPQSVDRRFASDVVDFLVEARYTPKSGVQVPLPLCAGMELLVLDFGTSGYCDFTLAKAVKRLLKTRDELCRGLAGPEFDLRDSNDRPFDPELGDFVEVREEKSAIRNASSEIPPDVFDGSKISKLSPEQLEGLIKAFGEISKTLSGEIATQTSVLQERRNALIPVHTLPLEVLKEVFLHVINEGQNHIVPCLKDLASVSRRWWQLIISTPELWASPRPCDTLELPLRKSKDALLTIHRDINLDPLPYADMLDLLRQNSARVESMHIIIGTYWLTYLSSCIQASFPNMHTLNLHRNDGTGMRDWVLNINAPNVRNLTLHSLLAQWNTGLLNNLESLHLQNLVVDEAFKQNLIAGLSTSPRLRSLHLQNISMETNSEPTTAAQEEEQPPQTTVVLRHLRKVEMQSVAYEIVDAVLRTVDAPDLTHLVVYVSYITSEKCSLILPSLVRGASMERTSLLVLAAGDSPSTPLEVRLTDDNVSIKRGSRLDLTLTTNESPKLYLLSSLVDVLRSSAETIPVNLNISPSGLGYEHPFDFSLLASIPGIRQTNFNLHSYPRTVDRRYTRDLFDFLAETKCVRLNASFEEVPLCVNLERVVMDFGPNGYCDYTLANTLTRFLQTRADALSSSGITPEERKLELVDTFDRVFDTTVGDFVTPPSPVESS
ncbi:hypothetical protein FRB99_005228 [Tulasnella sp. 403]|nr:hypothetical protein FRB99_005228 [Tulasnella sp. 403]